VTKKLPDECGERHETGEQSRNEIWTPKKIEAARVARVQEFEKELRVAMARDQQHIEADAEVESSEGFELLESGDGQWYLDQPEAKSDILAAWVDHVRRAWAAEIKACRQFEDHLREHLRSPFFADEEAMLAALSPDDMKKKIVEAQRREFLTQHLYRHDETAARYTSYKGIPEELRHAREIVRYAVHAARLLEKEFLEGKSPCSDVMAHDVKIACTFVQKAHTGIITSGLVSSIEGNPNRRQKTYAGRTYRAATRLDVLLEDPRKTYAALTTTEQLRWRVALMRYLDKCVKAGVTAFPSDREEFIIFASRIGQTPFALTDFAGSGADLTKLLASWSEKDAGAKPRGSGRTSKWKALRVLLEEVWGCESTPEALAREYARSMK